MTFKISLFIWVSLVFLFCSCQQNQNFYEKNIWHQDSLSCFHKHYSDFKTYYRFPEIQNVFDTEIVNMTCLKTRHFREKIFKDTIYSITKELLFIEEDIFIEYFYVLKKGDILHEAEKDLNEKYNSKIHINGDIFYLYDIAGKENTKICYNWAWMDEHEVTLANGDRFAVILICEEFTENEYTFCKYIVLDLKTKRLIWSKEVFKK